jgi:predicted membrane protein
MFCPKCGAQSEGGRFCRACGTNLATVSDALAASEQSRSVSTSRGGTTFGIFHSARLTNANYSLDGHSAASLFGTVVIDLTKGEMGSGETHIQVYTMFGTVVVTVPEDVGLRVTGFSIFSTVKARDVNLSNGMVSSNEYVSPGYAQATRRLHIDATTIFSTAKVKD